MNPRYVGTFCTVLVLGGTLIAGPANAADNADERMPVIGNSYQNPRVTQDNAFFYRYIDKAVKHAREAEIAGNQGHAPELLEHAQLSLDQAKEAQRAGNVPGLNEGIVALRQALNLPRTADDRTGNDRTAYDSTTGSIASCTSRTDANGTVIYDDPTCPTRYRQPQSASLQDATVHVRDARINLSKAGGIKPVEIRTSAR